MPLWQRIAPKTASAPHRLPCARYCYRRYCRYCQLYREQLFKSSIKLIVISFLRRIGGSQALLLP
jgi:hypothetical protein